MPPRSAFLAIAVLVLAAALFAPSVATAQTPGGGTGTIQNPIVGNYTDTYIVAGRVVDAVGGPVVGGEVTLEIDQKNTLAKPVRGITDCYGVFIMYFTIKQVDPAGKVLVKVAGRGGGPDVHASVNFDPFYRRSDLLLQYQGQWPSTCPEQSKYFPARVSIQGRIVNRTEPYTRDGATYDAVPYSGHAAIRWVDANGHVECPPFPDREGCQPQPVDERGDFRYSFVFDANRPFNATGVIQVLFGDRSWNFTLDPLYRAAIARIDVSGRGPPAYATTKPTPGVELAGVVALVAALALAARRPPRRGTR